MPLRKDIKKVMVIGSGPIVIGQAAEFDYAGTQACQALRADGLEVVLVNSNPATIMTDRHMADKIYIEPLTLATLKRIIEKEKPDSLLSTLGGQTGLTLSMQLAKEGFLDKHNVKLLGANPETIDKAEDRLLFKNTMMEIGQPVIPSAIAEDMETAFAFAKEQGYPLIIRPAFTLGGSGGGIVHNDEEMAITADAGLNASPIHQILVEKSVAGWKEIEFEVMRDSKGNVITVCAMENFDPVGVHTGDSIVVAPTMTLADKEYQMLRSAALSIISALKIEGGCNCQFALNADTFEYAVIEVNPRVSRSSALASKATGYPIAKVAAKIAVGWTLDEIVNAITKKTYACFEPALDYVVVKLPKWPFDKFVYADKTLGTQMKATGEVMAIGTNFETALLKAVRGAEIKLDSLNDKKLKNLSDEEIENKIFDCNDTRLFVIFEALKRGISIERIHEITKIDEWFLYKLYNLVKIEKRLISEELSDELYMTAKKYGYLDSTIESISGKKVKKPAKCAFKMIDTCAAEFAAETPYFYSSFDDENEAAEFIKDNATGKKTVIVFGSGPIRIGQGIEFDYASVHCVWALKKCGYDVVIVNNNPETVSTDFDTSDRLYFEPLTTEDVQHIIDTEKPYGVVVAFGGQTAIKLTNYLSNKGVNILGTSADSIDLAEDRERFDALLEKLHINRPEGTTVMNKADALAAANKIGYPVLVRPSYVLGGQNMIIAFNDDDITEYMDMILSYKIENPVLIDKYLMGTEIEVDAICDGENILIPGVMEHIERTGVHSGDSIAVYPSWNVSDAMLEKITEQSRQLSLEMKTKGLVNIQYLIWHDELYVIEVNPRSSRTVPYISKVTGIPMVELAVRIMLGEKLTDLGYGTGLYKTPPYTAVKVPVFSFEKLGGVDTQLGPEMKSTGEVLGIGHNIEEALYKGLVAAGYKMKKSDGGVLITVRNQDKNEIADLAKKFSKLGFTLYATEGTRRIINESEIDCEWVGKIGESDINCQTLIESGKVDYIISTSKKGRIPTRDSVKIRRKAIERRIPCITSIDTANALVNSLMSRYSEISTELVDINNMRESRQKLNFVKMHGCGNDYIYFDCFNQTVYNPEGLSAATADRHFGIGGDGTVLICPPEQGGDAKMRIFNLDGSEGKMGGNAIRCVGKYLYDYGYVDKQEIKIETGGGIKDVKLFVCGGTVKEACVNMGKADFNASSVPVNTDKKEVIGQIMPLAGNEYEITCLSIGNPHCVMFFDNVDRLDVEKLGPKFENDPIFPERVNVSFVKVLNSQTLKLRVWERGNGETWACGTGACAAVAAAVRNGFCEKGVDIKVKLRGGDLIVKYTDEAVYLTGNAEKVFVGEVEI